MAVRPTMLRSISAVPAPRGPRRCRRGRAGEEDLRRLGRTPHREPGLLRCPIVTAGIAVPDLVVGDLVHAGEELKHGSGRVEQVPKQVRAQIVPADPHHVGIRALGHDSGACGANGIDVVHLNGVVVEERDRAGLDQQVVTVMLDPHERERAVEHLVGDLEAEAVQVESVGFLEVWRCQHTWPSRRGVPPRPLRSRMHVQSCLLVKLLFKAVDDCELACRRGSETATFATWSSR